MPRTDARTAGRQIAHRYRNRGEPTEDLIQAAYVGMVKAINGFDAALGHAFQGYAAVTMLGEVKRHFRDRSWAVRVPHRYQERRAALNRAVAELTHHLGRSPTNAELAHRMGITEEETAVTLEAASAYSTTSLDAPTPTATTTRPHSAASCPTTTKPWPR